MPATIQEEKEMEVEEMNETALEQPVQDIVTAARWCVAATASLKLQKIRTLKRPYARLDQSSVFVLQSIQQNC
jgi:hypothetical protein